MTRTRVAVLKANAQELRARLQTYEHIISRIDDSLRPWAYAVWVSAIGFVLALLAWLCWPTLPWPYGPALAGAAILATAVSLFLLYGLRGDAMREARQCRVQYDRIAQELRDVEARLALENHQQGGDS
jgi:hypothetical protein